MAVSPSQTEWTREVPDDVQSILGGAPLPAPIASDAGGKARRKQRKREARHRRDAGRPPNSFERWRMITEVASEERHVVDLADHKARYALIILGALNAAVFFVFARHEVFVAIPGIVRSLLIGLLAVYTVLTFVFVFYAIECIRPHQLAQLGPPQSHEPRGLLFWETIARFEPEAYRRAWSEATFGELNSEAVVIVHRLARLIEHKYQAMDRLFGGLVLLTVLAMVLLSAYAFIAILG